MRFSDFSFGLSLGLPASCSVRPCCLCRDGLGLYMLCTAQHLLSASAGRTWAPDYFASTFAIASPCLPQRRPQSCLMTCDACSKRLLSPRRMHWCFTRTPPNLGELVCFSS